MSPLPSLATAHPLAATAATVTALALASAAASMLPPFRANQMPVAGRVCVVTGGSQGLGRSAALLLARQGAAAVIIVARDPAKLAAALADLRVFPCPPSLHFSCHSRPPSLPLPAAPASLPTPLLLPPIPAKTTEQAAAVSPSQKFDSLSADMGSSEATARAFEQIARTHGVPDIVWQCAGGTQPGYFKDYSGAALEHEMRANYFTAMHTAHAAIRLMHAPPPPAAAALAAPPAAPPARRHIIFTSSVVAFYPLAGYNAYSPAKAAMRSLADGLRQECLLYDIDVHCCFPATILTPGLAEEQKTKPELTKILEGIDEGQTADAVADICLRNLQRGQTLVTTSLMGSAMRGGSWGGSPRGNILVDTLFAWLLAVAWVVVSWAMDRDVRKYRRRLEAEGRPI